MHVINKEQNNKYSKQITQMTYSKKATQKYIFISPTSLTNNI